MATELNEAKIRVVLDLPKEDQPKPGERKEGEKGDGKPPSPGSGTASARREAMRRQTFGQIGRALRSILTSFPFPVGTALAATIGGLEANERLGPGGEAFMREMINAELKKRGIPAQMPETRAFAGVAKWYSDHKAFLQSWVKAVDRAQGVAAASLAGGGTMSLEMAGELFELERKMAEFEMSVLKDRRRIRSIAAGEGLAQSIQKEMEKAARDVGK